MRDRVGAVVTIGGIKLACKDCSLRELCLPLGLHEADLTALDRVVQRRRTLKKGETLYRYGDPLRSLYALKGGTVKTTGLMEDGRVQVTGFYMPGELLGVDAINADQHPCTAEALETVEVCDIPFHALEELAQKVPALQHQLFRIMSREIVRDEQMLMMLGRMTAEERLAAALVNFARRQARLGLSDRLLRLAMSRQDLGDYLGLALETVSRLFSRFQEEGLISVHGRQIEILDADRLRGMGSGMAGEVSVSA
ncbi:MAG: fumarate/nitrate reduction transcriptional regulator Fnr [Pseudomonadota bacterium]|nr:MAG: fumarate/nitrate reduction transcriptional regulator Fnr [Pseudomonadota bacterium]